MQPSVVALAAMTLAIGCGQGRETNSSKANTTGSLDGTGGNGTSGTTGGMTTGKSDSMGGQAGDVGVECRDDSDCTAARECFAATCTAGICLYSPMSRGTACATGFCNGAGNAVRCVPCVDDAGSGRPDTGCSSEAPVCDSRASPPVCLGCRQDSDCSGAVECSYSRCVDSVCESTALPRGSLCGRGICNGEMGETSCVTCIDDAATGIDMGCNAQEPVCNTSVEPALCTGCMQAADCDDNNDCTSDSCNEGVCEHATIVDGTPCPGGYCNGIPGMEACLTRYCQTDASCDDGATCTSETCTDDLVCLYTTDDSQCPDSGDVCRPNRCTVGTGCQQVDISRSFDLLTNGNFEAGETGWTVMSANYDQLIFPEDYIPTLRSHSYPNVAWLGGGDAELDESNSLSQTVSVPSGTVRLELSFFYQIRADELPDNHNHMQVKLLAVDSNQTDRDIVTLYNQDAAFAWAKFQVTVEASEWAGHDLTLEFSGTGIDGHTSFFVDSVSLVAVACHQ